MKIERVKLLNALKHCAKIASKRSTMPVLSHVLVESQGLRLRLFATNLETGVQFYIPTRTDSEWSVCVPASKFAEIVGAGTESEIALECDEPNATLTVVDGKSKVKLKGIHGSEMVQAALADANTPLRADLFWRGVALTAPFASTDEARPVMTCVHLNRDRLESTDGFRLSVAEIEDTGHDVLLPARALMDAASIFAGRDQILFGVDKGSAIFDGGDVAFYIALVEGRFPDVDSIIPKNTAHKITFNSEKMAAAVKLAMVTAPDTACLWMDIKPDGLTLTTTSDEIGNSEVTVSGESDAAENIGINGKFLRDALQVGSVSSLRWNGPRKPLLFRGVPGWTHVIMPMGEM